MIDSYIAQSIKRVMHKSFLVTFSLFIPMQASYQIHKIQGLSQTE